MKKSNIKFSSRQEKRGKWKVIHLINVEVEVNGGYRIPETLTVDNLLKVALTICGKQKKVAGADEC